jgi:hypothetical protein
VSDTRTPSRHTRMHDVLTAALTGTEADVRAALDLMDESELSRMRNTMNEIASLAEARRKGLRRTAGLL